MIQRRVAIYGRVSTEHLEQLSALRNQMDWYKNVAQMHSEWNVVQEYIDEGITGTSVEKRKAFQQMIKDASHKKFDLIVTREVCRFARNTVDTLTYTRELKRLGVEVYFVNDNIWTCDGDGELRLTIMATMAQEESRKVSERVTAGLKVAQQKGVLRGGNVLGYKKVNKTFVIDEEQSETVRMMFQWYSEGWGYKAICRMLEENGRKTMMGKPVWHASNVRIILNNPVYMGYQEQNKWRSDGYLTQKKIKTPPEERILVKGDYEPIVSEKLFYECQKLCSERRKELPSGTLVGKQIHKTVWLKKLICKCGSSFRRVKWSYSEKKKQYSYGYQCYKQLNYGMKYVEDAKEPDSEYDCDTKGFAEWKIQAATYAAINKALSESVEEVKDKVFKKISDAFEPDENDKNSSDETEQLQEELDKLKKRLSNYVSMRADGELSKIEFLEYKSQCDEQIRKLEKKINNTQHETPVSELKKVTLSKVSNYLDDLYSHPQSPCYDDNFVDVAISKIIAQGNDVFDIYFNTTDPNDITFDREQVKGSIFRKEVIPISVNTERRGTEPLIGIPLGQYALNVRDAVNFSRFTRKRINLREFSVITVNIFFTF